jgi:hypothetical protein
VDGPNSARLLLAEGSHAKLSVLVSREAPGMTQTARN